MALLPASVRPRLTAEYRRQMAMDGKVNHTKAAQVAGCTRHAAARAYEHGDPNRGHPPIRKLLEVAAREHAAAEELRQKALQESVTDAGTRQIADEVILCKNAKNGANSLIMTLVPLLVGVRQLAVDLNAVLTDPVKKAALAADPVEGLRVIRQFASCMGRAVETLSTAQQMEHLRTGKPTGIVGVVAQQEALSSATPEEAEAAAQEVLATAERLKQLQANDAKEEPGDGGSLLN